MLSPVVLIYQLHAPRPTFVAIAAGAWLILLLTPWRHRRVRLSAIVTCGAATALLLLSAALAEG